MSVRRFFIGEFLGTFLVVFFGCGCVAAAVTTGAQSGIFQVAIVWGVGVATAIHLTGALSGAHLNPAVTLALAAWNGFPLRRVVPYIVWQMLGAFAAAAVVYALFRDAIISFEAAHQVTRGLQGSEASAMIFAEFFPSPGGKPLTDATRALVSLPGAVSAEVVGTAILMVVILCCIDERNSSRPQLLTASIIGLTVAMLISITGPLTMCCLNPARDLAPRIFTTIAGWGTEPFRVNGHGWWLVYLVGPIAGAQVGGAIYHLLIRAHYATADVPQARQVEIHSEAVSSVPES